VRRTAYGIPHILANDYRDLGIAPDTRAPKTTCAFSLTRW
jgi:hypothetical protein